jgi:hypothetical protein
MSLTRQLVGKAFDLAQGGLKPQLGANALHLITDPFGLSLAAASLRLSEGRQRRVARVRAVADDLPPKAGADLSKGVWLSVPKHDEVLRVEGDDKISVVALKCHQPLRTFHARSQRTLL